MAVRVAVLILGALVLALRPAAAEVCRFAGTSNHDGRLTAKTEVSLTGGVMTVDVTAAFEAYAWLSDFQYLTEEISTWRGGEMQGLAANYRTVVNGRIRRQQWDVWDRVGGALQARRVQATSLEAFRQAHPGFVRHWPLAGFGQDWLADYAGATPVRRQDLDVGPSELAPGLRPALALVFYWSRFLPPGGAQVPVLLPGFKHQARVSLAFGAATAGDGWQRWQAPLVDDRLSGAPSAGAAWVSGDHHLLQLAFDLHAQGESGQVLIRTQGCQGVEVAP